MQGLTPTGAPLYEGGLGLGEQNPPTRYAFAGDPLSGEGWSEWGEGLSERVEDYGRRLSISRVIDNSIMASLDSGSVS